MELKEIWNNLFEEYYLTRPYYDGEIGDAFIAGCEFEYNRSHWFDPEKALPTISENGRSSEPVLCKITGGHIKVYRYDYSKNEWRSLGDKVISWAYIPN